ncbi:uncharacterized protein Gasu_46740 [Galdieria sulphuraria]|uniref:Uncharacterized protein n=1 Tax=Galdieria sulphuraria TaxID=130081 RepID=M2WV74_GALSU|nr:uncharacterized protein Gasu_46740 [Galdieria sulphuraria]EME27855.1 hypothetical protein Gasu_46740 [Galdieria sulphuraria]|eukprot:XP_005704375.1 hypothetical protein Gasu_46740 [Galdieria sulphuraria]
MISVGFLCYDYCRFHRIDGVQRYIRNNFAEETVKYIAVNKVRLDSLKNCLAQAVAVGTGFQKQSHNVPESYSWSERAWTFSIILVQFWFSLWRLFAMQCSTFIFIGFQMVSAPTNLPCFYQFIKVIWIPCRCYFFVNASLSHRRI